MNNLITRRRFGQVGLGAIAAGSGGAAFGQGLKTITFGLASKNISPLVAPFVLPEYLGYFKEEGLKGDIAVLGSNAATLAALEQGRIETIVGVPSFQLSLAADNKPVNLVNFFEYTYPFKWAIAVTPSSPLQSLSDLKGKRVGVHNLGTSEYKVGQILLSLAGVNPDSDVEWLAVGDAAGHAVNNGDVDALIYFDTGFGAIEASGIPLRYLPLPENIPHVGGLYIATTKERFEAEKKDLIGYCRAIAKAMVFIDENPEAASYIYIEMFPEAAPRNKEMKDKVAAVMIPLTKRMPLFKHYDTSITDYGFIKQEEVMEDVKFLRLEGKVADPWSRYSNDLIGEINNFDREPIRKAAREFKLPY
jgi:NitT/TauT family transport system substrate-binding protein